MYSWIFVKNIYFTNEFFYVLNFYFCRFFSFLFLPDNNFYFSFKVQLSTVTIMTGTQCVAMQSKSSCIAALMSSLKKELERVCKLEEIGGFNITPSLNETNPWYPRMKTWWGGDSPGTHRRHAIWTTQSSRGVSKNQRNQSRSDNVTLPPSLGHVPGEVEG